MASAISANFQHKGDVVAFTDFRILHTSKVRFLLAAPLTALLVTTVASGIQSHATKAQPVSIGNAAPFAVLAGSAVSNTNQTRIIGDLGVSPGS
ncbi:hypothetical protein, partial [Nonomuraea aurantiaca]|uniref:hypothetical protein n=1 Tax=Nonomuraea aurantiaca TaxID=2878562 RepID=UPI001CD995BA